MRGGCNRYLVFWVDVIGLLDVEHAHRALRSEHDVRMEDCERLHNCAFALRWIEVFPELRANVHPRMWRDEFAARDASREFAALVVVGRRRA